ncbi:lysozyme-like isoform X3 [Homarus americanus]|uniref:lysozyme-like isoform X2 n=1 Tax=Homarus americanus TaxID=6706 RepID=UPI001C48A277|nr:lysozyme-like isoform X2 [Homarus americanus]XP_042241678.1 lysozyme-like isoform X3 [Homarus americanus]
MSLVKTALLGLTAAIMVIMVCSQAAENVVSSNCMGCLCEASTRCNASAGCTTPYPGGYFCGAFLLSWAFWADAGKPVIKNDDPEKKGAFENCAFDLPCAAKAVRQYMKKFSADCNGDGEVTCIDFVRIHKYGVSGCRSPLVGAFKTQYEECTTRLGFI